VNVVIPSEARNLSLETKDLRDSLSPAAPRNDRRGGSFSILLGLVVMVDADTEMTRRRAAQLSDALEAAGTNERRNDKHIIVLIPKRHVETWIRALLGNQVDELTDYTRPTPAPKHIKEAAAELDEWTRPGGNPGPTSPLSLTASLPEWRKIPS